MQALTVRQPWAELIVRGTVTVHVRSWRTSHRGPLLIHAATAADAAACEAQDVARDVPRGALVGVVELVDCQAEPGGGTFAWRLRAARRFRAPLPFTGRRRLFEVPERTVAAALRSGSGKRPGPARPARAAAARRARTR